MTMAVWQFRLCGWVAAAVLLTFFYLFFKKALKFGMCKGHFFNRKTIGKSKVLLALGCLVVGKMGRGIWFPVKVIFEPWQIPNRNLIE